MAGRWRPPWRSPFVDGVDIGDACSLCTNAGLGSGHQYWAGHPRGSFSGLRLPWGGQAASSSSTVRTIVRGLNSRYTDGTAAGTTLLFDIDRLIRQWAIWVQTNWRHRLFRRQRWDKVVESCGALTGRPAAPGWSRTFWKEVRPACRNTRLQQRASCSSRQTTVLMAKSCGSATAPRPAP